MSRKPKKGKEHAFSIELKSKEYIERISIPNEIGDNALIEGSLGELEELGFIEGIMLEIKGANEIIRIDLIEEELRKMLPREESKTPFKS